jgi:hypothetical protein
VCAYLIVRSLRIAEKLSLNRNVARTQSGGSASTQGADAFWQKHHVNG